MREHLSSEHAVSQWLSGQGVAVVPTQLTRTAQEAAAFALQLGGPVVLKIASPDIPHKTEVGGVVLNLQGEDAVAAAWGAMMRRVTAARPDARIDGILVAPMRQGGVELFVGTLNDPQWGPALAVGLGGVWVEALRDTSLRLLPVSREDVSEMLAELRGARLLQGWRGAPAADVNKLADAIVAIGNAALRLGPGLASLEVNPLRADADTVEALDALAVWQPATS
jgi:succinyl-CoA synthetase beta subunit